ncbi:MAG TPA: hypothetical protein VLB90_07625, partial [Pseudomonadales bacterium]|nr:hypothetical protein [Pseudomonadales bacterium]
GAIFMLQSRYLLMDEQAVQTSVGKMNVLTFNVKVASIDAPSLHARREASPANDLAVLLAKDIQQAPSTSYAVIMSHEWFEPYIKQNGVRVDERWNGRFFNSASQEQALLSYLTAHPDVKHLYYVVMQEAALQPLVEALKKQAALECEQSIEVAAGQASLMRFDVKKHGSSADTIPPACVD